MTLIEIDPKQNKLVAILSVVALVAVAFVVIRLHGPAETKVAAQSNGSTSPEVQMSHGVRGHETPIHNPFLRPSGWQPVAGVSSIRAVRTNVSDSEKRDSLPPLQIDRSFSATIRPDSQPTATERTEPAAPKNDLILVATAGSRSHLCGIIKVGDSEPKVVSLGDTVAGNYKVKEITDARVILTNGSGVLVVNRQTAQPVDKPEKNK